MKKLNALKLILLLNLLTISSGCALWRAVLIRVTEEIHPEWNTNIVVGGVSNSIPSPVSNQPPVVIEGPRVEKVWARSDKVIGIKVAGIENWPTKTSETKTIVGMVCCNGKKFDWLSTGNVKGQQKTVDNLYGTEYFQDIKKGSTNQISIKDIHGKNETARVPFVWPWESTKRVHQ